MTRQGVTAALAILALIAACSTGTGSSVSHSTGQPLTIYAAASLKDTLDAVKTTYEAATPATTLVIATDSSATLRTQIEEGAPADIFLSADQTNPRRLVEAGLTNGDAVNFAGNRLAIIVPVDNPARIETPADLARPGISIVAAGDEVPISSYAQDLVANLAGEPAYPPDFADAYAANVVSKEENVRAVAAKIELGEGDAGIVYLTDAMTASNVAMIEIPASANVAVTYAGVVVGASSRLDAAHAFLDWLSGPDGAAVLAEFGFVPPT